jgi:hypothetical protein
MTEPEETPYAEILAAVNTTPVQVSLDPHEEGDSADFVAAIKHLFAVTIDALSVPDNDEETANDILGEAVQALMVHSFKAGMLFYDAYLLPEDALPAADTDGAITIPVPISPATATELVTGLMDEGISLRLVVDRNGPH